ncbi:MAG: hypothetical protein LAO05_11030 [Acidobacteriia bacterium]|nr:hypothetical protein [Terriglobia bacterium]
MDAPRTRVRAAALLASCGLLATLVAFLINLHRPFGLTDEGFQYLLSRSWARGENLFQRFELLYPAGQYAWYGAWMALLGDAVWVLRLGRALLCGVTAAVVWHAVRRWSGQAVAWAVAIAVAVADPGLAVGVAAAAVMALALSLARPQRPGPRVLAVTAALAGWALAWREDVAVLALALALYVAWRRRGGAPDALRAIGGLAAGLGPWLVLEAARGELAPFVSHLAERVGLLFPRLAQPRHTLLFLNYGASLSSPRAVVGSLVPLLVLVPPLIYVGLLVRQGWRAHGGLQVDRQQVAAALAGLAFVPQLLWERPDLWHLRAHLVVLLAVLGVVAGSFSARRRRQVAGALAALAAVMGVVLVIQYRLADAGVYPCGEGKRIGARLENGAPPWACLPSAPNETLIVLPWGPGWYALEAPVPGTRVLAAIDRHVTRAAIVDAACADLRRPANRWVITGRNWVRTARLPGEVAISQTILGGYRHVTTWNEWELWERVAGEEGKGKR